MTRRPAVMPSARGVVAAVLAVLLLVSLLPAAASGASPLQRISTCGTVNLRSAARVSARLVKRIPNGTRVTITARVTGGAWKASCAGTMKKGTGWYRISAINGRSAKSLYGVAAVYAAAGLFKAPPAPSTPKPTPKPSPSPTASAGPDPSPGDSPGPSPSPSASPTASPSPTPTAPITIGAQTTIYGRGWGHGVGMSQYGALGRAQAGQTAAQILSHYYRGTTLGTLPTAPFIRVLVLNDFAATAAKPLVLYGRTTDWTIDGVPGQFPPETRLQVIPTVKGTTTAWSIKVDDGAGVVLYNAPLPTGIVRMRTSGAGSLEVTSKTSSRNRYRGSLRIIASTTADVVNIVALETYLRGVVPSEVPASWPREVLRAQAIAARSYAVHHLRPGVSTFDVNDDTRSQVYGGALAEKAATTAEISATVGQVVLYKGAVANTLFHSTGGGATENNENAFVSATGAKVAGVVAYLRGSKDRRSDGSSYDGMAPKATWRTRAYTKAELSAIFAADSRTNVGTLRTLDLRNRGVSGRLISVTLAGTAGSKKVSGSVFMAVFNAHRPPGDAAIWSTLLDVIPIP